eukprot:gnl/Chilomastix_cuspidata/3198.p1 GENE.gnl/Chilomastix_cuspidata/3198~~gnl/Chilomastix_cuspidata/3198.p1  ORF type:complete len:363 (-),score=78.60 gnl/Chilomastix_cuspidata/3198:29-1117(-)
MYIVQFLAFCAFILASLLLNLRFDRVLEAFVSHATPVSPAQDFLIWFLNFGLLMLLLWVVGQVVLGAKEANGSQGRATANNLIIAVSVVLHAAWSYTWSRNIKYMHTPFMLLSVVLAAAALFNVARPRLSAAPKRWNTASLRKRHILHFLLVAGPLGCFFATILAVFALDLVDLLDGISPINQTNLAIIQGVLYALLVLSALIALSPTILLMALAFLSAQLWQTARQHTVAEDIVEMSALLIAPTLLAAALGLLVRLIRSMRSPQHARARSTVQCPEKSAEIPEREANAPVTQVYTAPDESINYQLSAFTQASIQNSFHPMNTIRFTAEETGSTQIGAIRFGARGHTASVDAADTPPECENK